MAEVWYTTSLLGPDAQGNPTWKSRPDASLIHAKRAGTMFTACGLDATSWHKHWVLFEPTLKRSNRCGECIDVTSSIRLSTTSSRW